MKKSFQVLARPVIRRRGAIAVLVAVLMIPMLAFVAFCVDIGWMTTTKSELQNATDSAAAAGARQLVDNYGAYSAASSSQRQTLVASAKSAASTYSRQFGGYNNAGGVAALQVLPSDIQFGFTDASGNYESSATYAGYPNTVQVLVRRDASANGRLPLFFAGVMGKRDTALTATASATIFTGSITGFDPHGGGDGGSAGGGGCNAGGGAAGDDYSGDGSGEGCGLLPVAFDINVWNQFFTTGKSADGVVYTDAAGSPQIQVYPSPQNAPGNFGLLCLGPDTNATPSYSNWILNGPCDSDLQNLIDRGRFPVSESAPKAWKGTPGLRNTLRSDFEAIIGQPRLLPLFKPASASPYQAAAGAGNNATYNIVGFVGVTVTSVTGNGNNLNITVQPCSVIDPTAVYDPDSIYPAGAEPAGQLKTFTHVSAKFSR
ncbi:MAG: pilus assembly protein TadG-related protein [Planctomycetales bacterium]|nr:pilus assembly protein TadG-related protein [Planctomycetales bacterium]